jgi:DNA polymerase III alpha subunit
LIIPTYKKKLRSNRNSEALEITVQSHPMNAQVSRLRSQAYFELSSYECNEKAQQRGNQASFFILVHRACKKQPSDRSNKVRPQATKERRS